MTTATQYWGEALRDWAIPPEILDSAPRPPWGFPVARFAERTDVALAAPAGVTFEQTQQWLGGGGSLLDVGAGVGYASLPLAPPATSVTAVDPVPEMLEAYAERARRIGVPFRTILGRWPDVADEAGAHDVVVASNVFYDVQDLGPFVDAMTAHARRRVVVEHTTRHPLSWTSPLWLTFHDVVRPTRPTSTDLEAALRDRGVRDLVCTPWVRHNGYGAGDPDRVALVTRRLCLPEDRELDVAAALRELDSRAPAASDGSRGTDVVTMTWAGTA